VKIGLSLLCENPKRRTGLTSLFSSFVTHALELDPDVSFVLFCAEGQSLGLDSDRVEEDSRFAGNDRMGRRLLAEHFEIGPAARKAGCDVLITTGLVPVRAELPVVMQLFTLHHLTATNQMSPLRSKYRKWATRHGMRKAALIITNTQFACRQILSVNPEVAGKLLQSYEGIDHRRFFPADRATGPELDKLKEKFGIPDQYFFWCSNFYPYKQAELLMEAWCDLPEAMRTQAPLVMVGGGGWGDSKAETLAIAQRRGAADTVKMLDWVSDDNIPGLFRHASVFVHPSREETFGRSVLEAMASGVPCVVQDIPVMPEVTGGHAISIQYADRAAASNALRHAMTDVAWRQSVIKAGVQQAGSFSFRRLSAERLRAIYLAVGKEPPAACLEFPLTYGDSIPGPEAKNK